MQSEHGVYRELRENDALLELTHRTLLRLPVLAHRASEWMVGEAVLVTNRNPGNFVAKLPIWLTVIVVAAALTRGTQAPNGQCPQASRGATSSLSYIRGLQCAYSSSQSGRACRAPRVQSQKRAWGCCVQVRRNASGVYSIVVTLNGASDDIWDAAEEGGGTAEWSCGSIFCQ